MITMEMLGKVKRLYSRDKKSLHEIAKTTGLSRNTIRKWVRGTDEVDKPSYRRKETANKLTAFHQALELALKADSHRTKQNRRTAKALFGQIKADGYAGGYSRVTDFIRAWRDTAGKAPKAFVPLAFALMAISNSPTRGHPKFPQAGRPDYDDSGVMAIRAAASLSR